MFTRKLSVQQSPSKETPSATSESASSNRSSAMAEANDLPPATVPAAPATAASTPLKASSTIASTVKKRSLTEPSSNKPLKRSKSGSAAPAPTATGRGQQSLKGFFKPKTPPSIDTGSPRLTEEADVSPVARNKAHPSTRSLQPAAEILRRSTVILDSQQLAATPSTKATSPAVQSPTSSGHGYESVTASPSPPKNTPVKTDSLIHDPIESKESWSRLFTKPAAPRCEGHDEPCITLLTKKSGMNCGRSFWMCPRPLGPSGAKEKNTQWRCQTFIWCSDWNPGTL